MTAVPLPASLADLEAIALPAVVLDLDGKIVALNAACVGLVARPVAEIIGRLAWEFAPGLEYLWDERVAAARAPGGVRFEIAISTGRGAVMLEYLVAVYELDGKPAVVVVITSARPLS